MELNNSFEIIDNCEKYSYPGVWALLGKEKDSDLYICLQVGQTVNIATEINENIKYLSEEKPKPIDKKWVNYFGENMFDYKDYTKEWNRKVLYHKIATSYDNFSFVCILKNEEEKAVREDIERYFAIMTKSRYWRPTGRQVKEKNEKEQNDKSFLIERKKEAERIKDKYIKTEYEKIIKQIDENYKKLYKLKSSKN